jgi:hypothetical protein
MRNPARKRWLWSAPLAGLAVVAELIGDPCDLVRPENDRRPELP